MTALSLTQAVTKSGPAKKPKLSQPKARATTTAPLKKTRLLAHDPERVQAASDELDSASLVPSSNLTAATPEERRTIYDRAVEACEMAKHARLSLHPTRYTVEEVGHPRLLDRDTDGVAGGDPYVPGTRYERLAHAETTFGRVVRSPRGSGVRQEDIRCHWRQVSPLIGRIV